MKITKNSEAGNTIAFTIEDENYSLVHSIRQIADRDIACYAFGKIKLVKNDSLIQDEIISNQLSKLKLNQKELLSRYDEPEKVKFVLNVVGKDDFELVTSDDIKDSKGVSMGEIFDVQNVYICTIKAERSFHAELYLEKRTKRETGNTAFLNCCLYGYDSNSTVTARKCTITLLGTYNFKELMHLTREHLKGELKEFQSEMKKVKEEYNLGYIFKTSRYDYVILNIIVSEIHLLYPDIGFCATNKEHPSFSDSTFILYDKDGKEMDIIKIAVDSLLKRI